MITRLSDALQPCRGTDTSECPNFNRTGGRFRSWNCSLGIFPWGEVVTDYVMHEDLTCGCRIKMASVHFANFNLWKFWGNTIFLYSCFFWVRYHLENEMVSIEIFQILGRFHGKSAEHLWLHHRNHLWWSRVLQAPEHRYNVRPPSYK